VSFLFLFALAVLLNIICSCHTPHSTTKGTPVLITTSTLLRPLLLLRRDWLNCYAYRQFLSRPELSHSLLSISQASQTPFTCLAGSSVVHDIPCNLFFFKCRSLGRLYRSPINHDPTSLLHPIHLLARHGYRVHWRSPSVCIASVQCFERRQGEIRILRVAVTIVDYTCIAIVA
jgi:hypothetical protein